MTTTSIQHDFCLYLKRIELNISFHLSMHFFPFHTLSSRFDSARFSFRLLFSLFCIKLLIGFALFGFVEPDMIANFCAGVYKIESYLQRLVYCLYTYIYIGYTACFYMSAMDGDDAKEMMTPKEKRADKMARKIMKKMQVFEPHIHMKRTDITVLTGMPGAGKTTALDYLLSKIYSWYDIIHFYSPTNACNFSEDGGNVSFDTRIPPKCLHSNVNMAKVLNIHRNHKKQWEDYANIKKVQDVQRRRGLEVAHEPVEPPYALIVFDDCSFNKRMWKQVEVLFKNHRHSRIGMIITMQDLLDLPIEARTCINNAMCANETNIVNKERMQKHYFGMFDITQLGAVLKYATQDHCFLTMRRKQGSGTYQYSEVFRFVPKPVTTPYRVGPDSVWEQAEHDMLQKHKRNKKKKKRTKVKMTAEQMMNQYEEQQKLSLPIYQVVSNKDAHIPQSMRKWKKSLKKRKKKHTVTFRPKTMLQAHTRKKNDPRRR